jgi:hypothetical protein
MTPVEPTRRRARWRVIYEDLMRGQPENHVITYEEMASALGLDPIADRPVIIGAARRAIAELEESDNRSAVSVRGVGYRMAEPGEHLKIGRARKQRSEVALRGARRAVVNVDLSRVPEHERPALLGLARLVEAQLDFNDRAQKRMDRLDDLLAEHEERLSRLEQGDAGNGDEA